MPAAFALGMNSGKIILTEQCRAVCGPPGIAFSQMELGRQGAAAAPASYGSGGAAGGRASPLSRAPLGSSPKGRGFTAGDGEGEDAYEGQAVFVLAALTGDVPSPIAAQR